MTNPIRRIRMFEGRTLQEFAGDIGVHYQAVYLNECGVYQSILPVVMDHLEKLGYDSSLLNEEYQEAVRKKRELNGVKYAFDEFEELGEPTSRNPFTLFRESIPLTRSKFCKEFCVHPASVRKLELGETLTMPGQLLRALHDAGLKETIIDEICDRLEEQTVWRVPLPPTREPVLIVPQQTKQVSYPSAS